MQSFTNCSIRLTVGRPVVLHDTEGRDHPGEIVTAAPEGALIACEDGVVRGADWSHVDLLIGGADFTANPNTPGVTEAGFTVKPGDTITAMSQPDGDRFEVEVLGLSEFGPFVRIVEDGRYRGRVFGAAWADCDMELASPDLTA